MVVLERYLMAGTAGHVDHGKTALVGALTGIDTTGSKRRNAAGSPSTLASPPGAGGGLRIGFVDVPGHERFVKNMLAGSAALTWSCS